MTMPAGPDPLVEKSVEQWQLALSLGTWWWNAAVELWCPPQPQSHSHHEVTVPPALETDEPALFA